MSRRVEIQVPSYRSGYLTTSEVAALFEVSPKTVVRWARDGELPFKRTLGGHRRYPEDKIRQLLDASTVPAENQAG